MAVVASTCWDACCLTGTYQLKDVGMGFWVKHRATLKEKVSEAVGPKSGPEYALQQDSDPKTTDKVTKEQFRSIHI